MARDWETWLRNSTGPASETEEQDRDRTEKRIRDAIIASDLPSSVRVYAKGSFANNTNVRRDADVDVAVEWNETIKVNTWGDTAGMTPAQLGYTPVDEAMTPDEFRRRVERALIAAFGTGPVDSTPDKHVGVMAGAGTLDADVVPCFALDRYDAPRATCRGHRIYAKSGGSVDNFPKQNYENGVAKNDATSRRYKENVRCIKRLVGELYDDRVISRDYPGYLLESLVYNVPNPRFGHDRRYDDIQSAFGYLWNGLQDESVYLAWREPSELLMLFRGRADRIPRNALNVIEKAWQRIGIP